MKVYFNCNFTGHKPYERPGKPVVINKSFTWNGYLWLVPAAYEFKEGLVIDFCKRIPMAEAERFFADWPEGRRQEMSLNEEIELLERETPFTTGFSPRFTANGRALESSLGMCCTGWHSLGAEIHYVEEVAEELMEAYHCDRNYAWYFCRMRLNWKRYEQPSVTSLIMTLEPGKNVLYLQRTLYYFCGFGPL